MARRYIIKSVNLQLEVPPEKHKILLNHLITYNKLRNEMAADPAMQDCEYYSVAHKYVYRYFCDRYSGFQTSVIEQAGRSVASTNRIRHKWIKRYEGRKRYCASHNLTFAAKDLRCLKKLHDQKFSRFKTTASVEATTSSFSVDFNTNTLEMSIWGYKWPNRFSVGFRLNKRSRLLATLPTTLRRQGRLVYDTKQHKFIFQLTIMLLIRPQIDLLNVVPEKTLGVDLGVVNHAALSNGKLFTAEKTNKYIKHYRAVQRSLQKRNTKSAHRKLIRRRGKLGRYLYNVRHCVARDVVNEAIRCTCNALVLEKLYNANRLNVRKGRAINTKNWAYRHLKKYIVDRAIVYGLACFDVLCAHTSDTCPICGCSHKDNRVEQAWFRCIKCGYIAHADVNAARNIYKKFFAMDPLDRGKADCGKGIILNQDT